MHVDGRWMKCACSWDVDEYFIPGPAVPDLPLNRWIHLPPGPPTMADLRRAMLREMLRDALGPDFDINR